MSYAGRLGEVTATTPSAIALKARAATALRPKGALSTSHTPFAVPAIAVADPRSIWLGAAPSWDMAASKIQIPQCGFDYLFSRAVMLGADTWWLMQNPPISRSTILGAARQGYGARSRRGVLHNPPGRAW